MSAVALSTAAAGGSDSPAQQPEEEITVRVVSPSAEYAEELAVCTSFSCPVHLPATASLAKGMQVLLVQSTSDSSPAGLHALLVPASRRDDDDPRKAARELRGWLMVLATVIASITYASGLSMPSRFQDTHDNHSVRYMTFCYCNTTAFALSLSIVVLLASQDLRRLAKIKVLEILVALDVLALLVAYIVGSTFGFKGLVVCGGLVLIVPVALVIMSSRVCGTYFWDEL